MEERVISNCFGVYGDYLGVWAESPRRYAVKRTQLGLSTLPPIDVLQPQGRPGRCRQGGEVQRLDVGSAVADARGPQLRLQVVERGDLGVDARRGRRRGDAVLRDVDHRADSGLLLRGRHPAERGQHRGRVPLQLGQCDLAAGGAVRLHRGGAVEHRRGPDAARVALVGVERDERLEQRGEAGEQRVRVGRTQAGGQGAEADEQLGVRVAGRRGGLGCPQGEDRAAGGRIGHALGGGEGHVGVLEQAGCLREGHDLERVGQSAFGDRLDRVEHTPNGRVDLLDLVGFSLGLDVVELHGIGLLVGFAAAAASGCPDSLEAGLYPFVRVLDELRHSGLSCKRWVPGSCKTRVRRSVVHTLGRFAVWSASEHKCSNGSSTPK